MKTRLFLLLITTLSFIGFSISAKATTVISTPSTVLFQLIVPSLKSGVKFMVEGNYLRPANADLTYASVFDAGENVTKNSSLVPGYSFGFKVGVGYVFKHSGNDVQINWAHFDRATSTMEPQVISAQGNTITTAFGSTIDLGPNQTVAASSKATFKQDAVDVEIGQYLDLNTRLRARIFGGFRYAYLQNNVTDIYVRRDNVIPMNNQTIIEQLNAHFSGIGPRLGMSTHYDMGNNFGVIGQFASALLADGSRVVSELDTKLGLDCIVPFKRGMYPMIVEAGYQGTVYIDAIQHMYPNSAVVNSNMSLSGPYVSLNMKL